MANDVKAAFDGVSPLNQNVGFSLVAVTPAGEPVPLKGATWRLLRENVDYIWHQRGDRWRTEIVRTDGPTLSEGTVDLGADPVSVTGVAPKDKLWPLVISAAFSQSLSPEKLQALHRRYFRLHFQYLCAFDRPKDYDYFQITAGPLTLGQRFQGRAPSKSRIEAPLSGWRST